MSKTLSQPEAIVHPLMACGHAANAVDGDGSPCCAICIGINDGATKIVGTPDLSYRRARCPHCGNTAPSSVDLAFFEYRPDRDIDSFYCGCHGWS